MAKLWQPWQVGGIVGVYGNTGVSDLALWRLGGQSPVKKIAETAAVSPKLVHLESLLVKSGSNLSSMFAGLLSKWR